MLVKDIMKKEVITITEENTVSEALHLLELHHIRHIPVLDNNNHVIGIVSDRDIRDASPSILNQGADQSILNTPIKEIMTSPVVTTHPLDFFDEAATIFYQREFACLPVVRNKELVGIITEKDMLYAFIQLTGTHSPSTQIEVKMENRTGALADVSQYFKQHQVKVISVYSYPDPKESDYMVLVFRIQTINPRPLIDALEQSEFEILYPFLEDQDEF